LLQTARTLEDAIYEYDVFLGIKEIPIQALMAPEIWGFQNL
jgi:hypothetical protein